VKLIAPVPSAPKIYLLLPVHNRREITREFLECYFKQEGALTTLIVIDDGSSDGTAEMVFRANAGSVILRGTGHWWWAGSLQRGLDWITHQGAGDEDVVLFINDDSRFDPDFIAKGIAALGKSPGALVQAAIRCAENGEVVDRGYVFEPRSLLFRPVNHGEAPNCLTTNGLFARWGDLKRIGRFHPFLLPHYLSDYEYTWRAGRRGLALHVAEDLVLSWQRGSTGYRQIDACRTLDFLGKLLSPRYPSNPIYTTTFAFLACPLHLALGHAVRIWRGALDTWVVWRRQRESR
jgi:GT2 family glycosyltransferase